MSFDINDIKAGVKVTLSDGSEGIVKGSYMSGDGFMLRVLPGGGGIVQRNVRLKDVTGVIDPTRIDMAAELHSRGIASEEEK